MQADQIERLLSIESISVIGLLLAICALLIYYNIKQRNDYKELQAEFIKAQKETQDILLDVTEKYSKDVTTVIQILNNRSNV